MRASAKEALVSSFLVLAFALYASSQVPVSEGMAQARAQMAAELEQHRLAALQALAAALPARLEELSSVNREGVVSEVKRRAAEMNMDASPEILTDLLMQKAWIDFYIDDCKVRGDESEYCRALPETLRQLDQRFRELTGLSMEEFKSGHRRVPGSRTAAPDMGFVGDQLVLAQSERVNPYHCVCDVYVYNSNRWMNRYWALECGGGSNCIGAHDGHGYCGDVDACHSPGSGAMDGTIDVFHGLDARGMYCPNDNFTCFAGPHSGHWYSICNCDWLHCRQDPSQQFYCGDETYAPEVFQGSWFGMLDDGACNYQWIWVREWYEENDPGCCDDPLGELNATVQIFDGWRDSPVALSATNCNDGSQSGVPPNCGSFGATIRLRTYCETRIDSADGSCEGRCGDMGPPDAACMCDDLCLQYGDCCGDYRRVCGRII